MPDIQLLIVTAFSLGFLHTVFGPDHYLPFIVMAQSGKWTISKTFLITVLSGVGHVLGSVVLGFIGVGLGVALQRLQVIESFRGDIAGWMLIGFGLLYSIWGVRQAIRNKPHCHLHAHDGDLHTHQHKHHASHLHAHESKASMTPWIIFLIFLFGPCETLIPLLMYPAAQHDMAGLLQVVGAFSVSTIGTMLMIVMLSTYGLNLVPDKGFERYSHAIAGVAIFVCGLSIQFLGL